MNERKRESQNYIQEIEEILQYVNTKKEELEKHSFILENSLKELLFENKENEKFLEINISKKDKNRTLFSPYSAVDDNNTENEINEKILLINSKIIELKKKVDEVSVEKEKLNRLIEIIIHQKSENGSNNVNEANSNGKEVSSFYEKFDEFGKKIIEAQELERKRIARDLHDSTVQNLTGLIHKAELCTRLIDFDTMRTKLELLTMKDTIKKTVNDMRAIIYDLRPMSLTDLGLVPTIDSFLNNIKGQHGIQTKLQVINEEKTLSTVTNLSLFRVIQEACNNTVKHANATTIIVKVEYLNDHLKLVITDDGKGFEIDSIHNDSLRDARNFGLSIMKERIFLLSGNIKINSKINEGTMIIIEVPYYTNEGRVQSEYN